MKKQGGVGRPEGGVAKRGAGAERFLIRRLSPLRQAADRLFGESSRGLKPGELSCRSGCFGCCLGLFAISLAEALLVREGVRRLPAAEREDVLGRARRIVEREAAHFPGDAAAGTLDPERSEEADGLWFERVAHTACPLLELPSGRCRIYPLRPVSCRTYGLAWRTGKKVVLPACSLNFVGAPAERETETAIDLEDLSRSDQSVGEALLSVGLPAGVETTIPHALVGEAFEKLRPEPGPRRPRELRQLRRPRAPG